MTIYFNTSGIRTYNLTSIFDIDTDNDFDKKKCCQDNMPGPPPPPYSQLGTTNFFTHLWRKIIF